MSETSDLAKELRKVRGELATLRNEFAQVRGRQDVWAANGLDDLDAGHGNQRFAGNRGRADSTGIQYITPDAGADFFIWFYENFSTTTGDTATSTYPYAAILADIQSAAWALFRLRTRGVVGKGFSQIEMFSSTTADTHYITLAARQVTGATREAGISLRSDETGLFYISLTAPLAIHDVAADPTTTLEDGMLWYRTDTDKIRARINGVTENLATETYVGTAAAPIGADYLVGTADGSLTGEIVVGITPGGELGGTWAIPTVDASHSGSTHAATQAAAEATAAAANTADIATHAGAADPHTGYVLESDANWIDLTDTGATTLHTHAGSGWAPAITAQVAGYTAVKNDVVLCTGTFTVTLTAAATVATGGVIVVKNVSTGAITVDGNAAETIDGVLTITLAQYDSVTLITDGSNWFVI